MSSEETKPAVRTRALAVAGLALALAGAGLVAATSATAATTPLPTLTVTGPSTLANNGTTGTLSVEVNNSASGNTALPADATHSDSLTVKVVVPTGVGCGNVTLSALPTGPSSVAQATSPTLKLDAAAVSPNCTYTASGFTQAQTTDVTYNYSYGINAAPLTGTASASASLTDVQSTNGNTITTSSSSNTLSTTLTGSTTTTQTAPSFVTSTPPAATVYQTTPYSFQLVANAGYNGGASTTYRAFGTPTTPNSDGIYGNGVNASANEAVTNPSTNQSDAAIPLEDGFYFDTVTGQIVHPGSFNYTDYQPEYSWTIIANNGFGGAAAGSNGLGGGTKAKPTPTVNQFDVLSPQFTLPTLYSDVAANNVFATPIYSLSEETNPVIAGYLDGTFRPNTSVTRAEFATFVERLIRGKNAETGPCNTGFFGSPSVFSDVPNSSQYCAQINDLNSLGIIKGNTNGTFSPNATVTRQAVAAFLYRSYSYEVTEGASVADAAQTTTPFTDVPKSNVFSGDIAWAAANKIANGTTATTFDPSGTATRGQSAAFIYRLQQFEDQSA